MVRNYLNQKYQSCKREKKCFEKNSGKIHELFGFNSVNRIIWCSIRHHPKNELFRYNSRIVWLYQRKPQTYSLCTRKHKKVTENLSQELLAIYKIAFAKIQRIAKILNLLFEIFCSERERTEPFMIFFTRDGFKHHVRILVFFFFLSSSAEFNANQ